MHPSDQCKARMNGHACFGVCQPNEGSCRNDCEEEAIARRLDWTEQGARIIWISGVDGASAPRHCRNDCEAEVVSLDVEGVRVATDGQ